MLLRKMFSRQWWLATLLVVVAAAVCTRLGIWQLDRLKERRAYNVHYVSMRAMQPLDLNAEADQDVETMEYRPVRVSGKYDFEHQIAIRNQIHNNQYGYHLLTPLLFDGKAVLVDRGWIPADGNSTSADWRKYDDADATVTVTGQIRLGQTKPAFGGVADALPSDGSKLEIWNNANLEQISQQLPYSIWMIYIQPDVDPTDVTPPIPYQPAIDLSEGPHLGYAFQWFTFATIFVIGYIIYLRKQGS